MSLGHARGDGTVGRQLKRIGKPRCIIAIIVVDCRVQIRLFRLDSTFSFSNVHLFDRYGRIRRFTDPRDIIKEHMEVRCENTIYSVSL